MAGRPSSTRSDQFRKAAAFWGATGVAFGAFGAHGLKKKLSEAKLESWKTAVAYQLFHSVALLSISALCSIQDRMPNSSFKNSTSVEKAGFCMLTGSTIFSGSIYMLCLDVGPKKLWGPLTPIGGLFLIGGWALLGLN